MRHGHNLKPNTQLLHSVWREASGYITKRDVQLKKVELDEVIANIFSNGPFYFYIVDFFDMHITYMSPLIKDIHGLDPDAVVFQDILDQIHPDDMEHVARAEAVVWDMLFNKLGPERNKKYKMSYCFRFRTSDGSYQLFNHQAVILTVDENGGLAKSLNIHTNISHLTSQNNYQISAIGMFGEPSYLDIGKDLDDNQLPRPSEAFFTRREKEIIRLISQGLTNEDISDKLFIATNTVKNHRKNILQKAGCKNAGQLITKCIIEGLL